MSSKQRSRRSTEAQATREVDGRTKIEQALAANASNLWHEIAPGADTFRRMSVNRRTDGTYLAVMTTEDAAGQRWVVFGSGESVMGAVWGLQNSIAKDAWKEDKLT